MSAPADPNIRQREASDGRHSAWVAASAGSGKTKVLTDRVLNLLLSGAAPERLLCLTFTKAAAAEMANRVNQRLSRWAVLPEMKLRAEILDLTGSPPEPETYAEARRLFARVLDTPGGMRILTIHAFCQSILRRFPLEAGIVPNVEIMDERSASELLAEAQNTVLLAARTEPPGGTLASALAEVTARIHEDGFAGLMTALAGERGRLQAALSDAGGRDAYLAELRARLGIKEADTEAGAIAAACREPAFDGPALRRAAERLITLGKPTDQKRGTGMATWLAADEASRAETWWDYLRLFLTAEMAPAKKLATNDVLKAEPWIADALTAEQQRVERMQHRLAAIAAGTSTAALIHLADAFLTAYAAEKRRRGLIDYDDLILATRALLSQPEIAPWVLYKLDGGIDHILIDEAQDTNPDQWQVVSALAEEFFAGSGARDANRTLFAVGDAKQSIFSFQRADPQKFIEMERYFRERATAAEKLLRPVPLHVSFRSTPAVLQAVDAVFAQPEARAGVALDDSEIRHEAFRQGMAGRVEHWPALKPDLEEDQDPWTLPLVQRSGEAPSARLARTIAETIRDWLDAGRILPARGRPVRPGDILVLVRRRGGFVRDLVRELKNRDIPVAGVDRIVLNRQLAVMDLVALGAFLLLPEDDLTLATVLKSPLCDLDEEALFRLAHGRPGTLWRAVQDSLEPAVMAAAEFLRHLLRRVDFASPHALYAELLGPGGARKRLARRLGPEAEDALDEFLAQTLAYEQAHVPSLQGFLHWISSGAAEVKRDLDQKDRDEVRIMTVHGAKGLQAPIVFLPDTVSTPAMLPALLWAEETFMLWAPGAGARAPLAAQAKDLAREKRDQEYRRLLYVALTRAEDEMIVCGWETRRAPSAASWHDLVARGIMGIETVQPLTLPGFEGRGHVLESPQSVPVPVATPIESAQSEPVRPLPGFVAQEAPDEPVPARPLVAAQPEHEEPAPRSPIGAGEDGHRFRRGLIVHRLLQSLPDLSPPAREAAARRYLARPGHGLTPQEQARIAAETLAVLADPTFGALFGPQSRAEVAVAGLVGKHAFSGRIDRLAVVGDEVLIVDYKTNRPPPRQVAEVAAAYVEQLSAYRAALERIYPEKRVRTLLLWTDGPFLMEIPPG
jgi:ATP-dependent helicase/nuclease subunit A